jgi:hypothetical protein
VITERYPTEEIRYYKGDFYQGKMNGKGIIRKNDGFEYESDYSLGIKVWEKKILK